MRRAYLSCFIALTWALPLAASGAKPLSETEKIEALIGTVAQLHDAVFVRNGATHDARAAADHLRKKWNAQKSDIKTARDFIRLAGSVSSMSGKPYLIRFKDGHEVKSADFLSAELDKLEGRAPPAGK
jgi:hypothetical protein